MTVMLVERLRIDCVPREVRVELHSGGIFSVHFPRITLLRAAERCFIQERDCIVAWFDCDLAEEQLILCTCWSKTLTNTQ